MKCRLGILISGRGSNFMAIADSIEEGRLPNTEIAVVISNKPYAPGLTFAADRALNARMISSKGLTRFDHEKQVIACLQEHRVDYVCLAGYMRLLSEHFVQAFPQRILNIHPSLLPAFPGTDAQKQALEYGAKVSGCTVHFVDEHLDAGPIILQRCVQVLPNDTVETLAARILEQEHAAYTEALRLVLAGEVEIQGRKVVPRRQSE